MTITEQNSVSLGAHFDIWVVDYHDYKPGAPENEDVFDTPEVCKNVEISSESLTSLPAQMRALVPTLDAGNFSNLIGT